MPCAVPWLHSYRTAPLAANGPLAGGQWVATRPAAPPERQRSWNPPL